MHFHATEVNLVLECDEDTELKVLYDDQALAEEMRGGDVDSDSVTHISKARLYNLVKSSIPLDGKLTLKPVKGGIRAYAFTFSGCH